MAPSKRREDASSAAAKAKEIARLTSEIRDLRAAVAQQRSDETGKDMNVSVLSVFEIACVLSLALCAVMTGCLLFPTINLATLKPGPGMSDWLLSVSRMTNIPIKLGILHGCLYFIEWSNGKSRGTVLSTHIGQRLTTLWVQGFQNPRWGQHLHMQIETMLQILEAMPVVGTFGTLFLTSAFIALLTQAGITSSGFHTFEEQMLGFLSAVAKSVILDRLIPMAGRVNEFVGSPFRDAQNCLSGALALASLRFIEVRATPTMIASALFAGAMASSFARALMDPARLRSDVYDAVIIRMTKAWYRVVLEDLPSGSRVLDVGIGTASALGENAKLVRTKKLTFVGVDYNAQYISRARRVVDETGISDRVSVHCKSLYDENLPSVTGSDFDAAYFSGSFSLMPDPAEALRVASKLVKDGGPVYITQTFQKRSIPFLQYFKPAIVYLTSIDFGQLIYERDVLKIIKDAGMVAIRNEVIRGSVDTYWQSARLIVVKKDA